jgi:acyl carrier protein
VPDIDAYFSNKDHFGPKMRDWDFYKQAIVLFCLSAGHHWQNCNSYIPDELLNRHNGMPTILSFAFYTSVLTGKDFYEALKDVLKAYGNEGMLDDIITMVKSETVRQHLASKKEELLKQLSVCEEDIRKQETALDITVASFGEGFTEEDLGFKISHCNRASFRAVLYEAENILGERLSVTDRLPDKEKKELLISKLSEKYNILISKRENLSVNTYEELIDVIQTHCRFLDSFKRAIFMGGTIDEISENDIYDIQTKINEICKLFGEDIDTSNVHNIEELKNAVTQKHPSLNFKDYLVDKLGVDSGEITESASFTNDLGADSLDIVEIIMHTENTLNIEIPDEDWGDASTIGDAYKLIQRKVLEKTLH